MTLAAGPSASAATLKHLKQDPRQSPGQSEELSAVDCGGALGGLPLHGRRCCSCCIGFLRTEAIAHPAIPGSCRPYSTGPILSSPRRSSAAACMHAWRASIQAILLRMQARLQHLSETSKERQMRMAGCAVGGQDHSCADGDHVDWCKGWCMGHPRDSQTWTSSPALTCPLLIV